MNIGVLGTGMVGQALAGKLTQIGNKVALGTRNVAKTLARTEQGSFGQPPIRTWLEQNPGIRLMSFADTARHGELIINATKGTGSLDALRQAGEDNLNGKVLVDIANPLDFSMGMPPFLTVSNTDSLAEQIQREFPKVKVVKTLNTVTASLMVNPSQLANGEHHIFLSGNDPAAKAQVTAWLKTWFGWKYILDLGDITTARGQEMYLPLWLRFWGALGTGIFNIHVIH